jgi:hypothetical protein
MLDWAFGVAGEFARIASAVRPGLSLLVPGGLGKLILSLQRAGFQTTPPRRISMLDWAYGVAGEFA